MFEKEKIYRRRELHELYGGQEQGGISTPAAQKLVMIFAGPSGEMYGYKDGWDGNGEFRFTGEGQVGDMQFVRGNLAIRDHAGNGKELHLFEAIGHGNVRYVGQMKYVGHDLVPNRPDRQGNPRMAIVFRLAPVP